MDTQRRCVTLWEAGTGEGSWQDQGTHEERKTYAAAALLAGLVTSQGTHTGAVWEEFQPEGGTHFREVSEGLSHIRRTRQWSRGVFILRRRKQQKQHMMK